MVNAEPENSVSGDAFVAEGASRSNASPFAVWRRRLPLWVLPALLVSVAFYYYGNSGRFVSTDNAYLKQDRVDVAARISGGVMQVFVAENTHVDVGQPILSIDDSLPRIGLAAAEAQLASARAEVAAQMAAYREKQGELGVAKRAAAAERDRATVELGHTLMKAPRVGMISHLQKPGSRAEIGRPIYAIVVDHSLWVEANLKETDLEFVRSGQTVAVTVDTYRQHHWSGRVESIAQATGAEFSLLSAQNASGNWVKVVQRIPVRIALTPGTDDPPLRDGMSANVAIDTGAHTRFDRWFGRGH